MLRTVPRVVSVILFVVIVTAVSSNPRHGRSSSLSHSYGGVHDVHHGATASSSNGAILRRYHRQTPSEDSYEDVVEYEYEDEVSPTDDTATGDENDTNTTPAAHDTPRKEEKTEPESGGEKKSDGNNEDGDEYYDNYDENQNGTNGADDEEQGKVEEEEEESYKEQNRDKSRARDEDDDADEDSAEREDRLEEERRQAEIREQERLEEERREEERREYQRRQEAAEEEEEEEDTEEDLRRREEEERIRAAAEAEEVTKSEEEAGERERETERRQHEDDDQKPNEDDETQEYDMDRGRVWFVSTTSSTTMAPTAHTETDEVEYEEVDEPEPTQPQQHEFEEERRHQHPEDNVDQDQDTREREEFEESDLNREYGPTGSNERENRVTPSPIPIEESGREELERYSTISDRDHDSRRPAAAHEDEHEEEEFAEEEDSRRVDEEHEHGQPLEPTRPPSYTPPYEIEQEEFEENEKAQTPEEEQEEEDGENEIDGGEEGRAAGTTTETPRIESEEEEAVVRFIPVSTTEQTRHYFYAPTTRQPHTHHTHMGEHEYTHHRHSNENEIDESVDEGDADEQELRSTTTERPYTTYTRTSVEEEEDYPERINQTPPPTRPTENALNVGRTEDHHDPRLREEDEEEEEEEDEGAGFYEGRRFNEETRRNKEHVVEDEDDGHAVDETHTHTGNRRPIVAANLDLSREPDDEDHDNEHDTDIDDVILEPSTTSTTTTTPRPVAAGNEIDKYDPSRQYPNNFNNRIDEDESDRLNSFYDMNRNYYDRTNRPYNRRPGYGEDVQRGRRPDGEYDERNNVVVVDYNVNHHRFGETPTKIECFSGYYLSDDGTECLDVDECPQNVCGSTQICLNTPGSYRCACNQGFVKDFRNELICRDINECEIGNGGCSNDCVNTQGSYFCSCPNGYDLAHDGRNCNFRPTTSTTTTTTTTTTPVPPTTAPTRPASFSTTPKATTPLSIITPDGTRISNCPTPPVPRGSGIAYLYCSRSPVGIHHRHSQLERRLLQDWAARRSRYNTSERVNSRFRLRRTLKRRRHPRQTTYSPGSMCELRCRSGFELKGQYTLHCNATTGLWQGTTAGFCQAIPKTDSKPVVISLPNSEATPNEIPRLLPSNEITVPDPTAHDRRPFKPSFRPSPPDSSAGSGGASSFRPNFYQLPVTTSRGPIVFTPPPPATRLSPNHVWNEARQKQTSTTPSSATIPTNRPYYNYYSPVTPFRPLIIPSTTTTTTTTPVPTTTRNSFIHLTYRFKTPWIKCPDDIKIDLQPGQRLAYVIIPQPQTNVDWWRQVTSEPSWAKGLETEIGPGKQKIVFRARTPAPLNNSAECSFVLEVRDIEPPTIRDCPESFSVRLTPGQSARAVTWVEPHFSDNVRVQTIKKSREPGLIMTAGEHVVNYEVSDSSNNRAKCTFTIQVVPSTPVADSRFSHHNNLYRKPVATEGIAVTTLNPIKTDVHSTIKNVVCHVGKKGRRIVFQSRVIPRGCTEMQSDVSEDSGMLQQNGAAAAGQYNTLNTLVQNSAENSATSQISSVSFSSNDHPQSASAFGQAVSNGRHSNRLVHSTSVVTNGAHGTSSRASSYALSSNRNFDTPLVHTADKQVYDEDFVVPSSVGPRTRVSNGWSDSKHHRISTDDDQEPRDFARSGAYGRERYLNPEVKSAAGSTSAGAGNLNSLSKNYQDPNQQDQNQTPEYRKYFRHFDSWDSAGRRF